MLRVPNLGRRIFVRSCYLGSKTPVRHSSRDGPKYPRAGKKEGNAKNRIRKDAGKGTGPEEPRTPSLVEQLFPEETKRYEEAQKAASREIPRLPLDTAEPFQRLDVRRNAEPAIGVPALLSHSSRRMQEQMRRQDQQDKQTTVLVLRNASSNLVEEDFRRLIPQGKHMEGWTLEQGDILKIIPARDLATLEQRNHYYLLFSSKLSAFTYQGQAIRIFHLASAHTPSSMTSAMPPPPGYMVDGVDAHAAIEAFALIPASQNLELRQLQPPLSPMLESIVRNQSYASLVKRSDRMPFEVRLTLDGPQLHANTIRFILHASGKDRALAWSGGDEIIPRISKWDPQFAPSERDRTSQGAMKVARSLANERTEEDQMQFDAERLESRQGIDAVGNGNGQVQQVRRTPQLVYVVGFYTQSAAQTFISYWHRRPMAWQGVDSGKDEEEDLPPVANVEMLW